MTAIGEVNSDFLTWRRFDRMILSWIFSSLTPEIMGQIIGYQTSNTTWVALEKIFVASSKARIMQLRLAFQTTQKGSLPIMEYILKMKTIIDNLAAIGEPVAERDQILRLFAGFGADYNLIVTSLTTCEDDLILHSVHSILLSHEQILHFQNSTAEDEVISAHITTQDHPQQSRKYHTRKPSSSFNS